MWRCLRTDNYEVVDKTLKPVQDALRPTFEPAAVAKIDQNRILAQDAFGVSYLPGRRRDYEPAGPLS